MYLLTRLFIFSSIFIQLYLVVIAWPSNIFKITNSRFPSIRFTSIINYYRSSRLYSTQKSKPLFSPSASFIFLLSRAINTPYLKCIIIVNNKNNSFLCFLFFIVCSLPPLLFGQLRRDAFSHAVLVPDYQQVLHSDYCAIDLYTHNISYACNSILPRSRTFRRIVPKPCTIGQHVQHVFVCKFRFKVFCFFFFFVLYIVISVTDLITQFLSYEYYCFTQQYYHYYRIRPYIFTIEVIKRIAPKRNIDGTR